MILHEITHNLFKVWPKNSFSSSYFDFKLWQHERCHGILSCMFMVSLTLHVSASCRSLLLFGISMKLFVSAAPLGSEWEVWELWEPPVEPGGLHASQSGDFISECQWNFLWSKHTYWTLRCLKLQFNMINLESGGQLLTYLLLYMMIIKSSWFCKLITV